MRLVALAVLATACGSDSHSVPPIFPADYAATYTEVRNCRPSIEHGAVNVRVLAAPDALVPYTGRMMAFPEGAIVLKEEYPSADTACAGAIRYWTVMEKLADGSSPDTLDWHWQKLDSTRHVLLDDDQSCIACHQMCTAANGGYLYTCTAP
jgi:cytochrome P460